jgi:hypothetical protein
MRQQLAAFLKMHRVSKKSHIGGFCNIFTLRSSATAAAGNQKAKVSSTPDVLLIDIPATPVPMSETKSNKPLLYAVFRNPLEPRGATMDN